MFTKEIRDNICKALKHSTADYCEIRIEDSEVSSIGFRGPEIDRVSKNNSVGGNVRALHAGGWGFMSFDNLDNLEIKVEETCNQAKILGQRLKKDISLYPVAIVEDCVPGNFKKEPFSISLRDKMELLQGYNDLILGQDGITSSRVTYFDKHTDLYFGNNQGTFIYQEKLDMGGSLMPVATRNRVTTQDMVGYGSNTDYNVILNLEDKVLQACKNACNLLDAPVIKSGQYTVILDPIMAGVFIHEAFGHLSEADSLDENERMKELLKIGTVYGSPHLDIYDSGLEGGNRGECKYDDEGVPMQKTYLIKKGAIAGHLHSRESAWKMGEQPTGNARAISYRYPPIVRMRTTCIAPGKYTFEEMLQSIGEGIYVQGAYGGQTNGEMFTFAALRANMIRNGQVSEPIRDVNLTGNVFTTLKNIEMIGNDFEYSNSGGGCGKNEQGPLPVSEASPHIRIKNVVIGGDK